MAWKNAFQLPRGETRWLGGAYGTRSPFQLIILFSALKKKKKKMRPYAHLFYFLNAPIFLCVFKFGLRVWNCRGSVESCHLTHLKKKRRRRRGGGQTWKRYNIWPPLTRWCEGEEVAKGVSCYTWQRISPWSDFCCLCEWVQHGRKLSGMKRRRRRGRRGGAPYPAGE